MFREQTAGRNGEALRLALEGCEIAKARKDTPSGPYNDFHQDYWHLLSLAVEAAADLDDPVSWDQVWREASSPVAPIEGYYASDVMLGVSRWKEKIGDRAEAVRTANLALGADPTWSAPSIWAARLGLRGAPFDPAGMLRDAVFIEPKARKSILEDPEFIRAGGLLEAFR